MVTREKPRPLSFAFALAVLILGFPYLLQSQVPAAKAGRLQEVGPAERGERLFDGQIPFRNGGPPCAACHSVAGLPFPGGGSLGPDLTGISIKLGPLGIDPTLLTLFFPAMTPIYETHTLALNERDDLKAFFSAVAVRPVNSGTTSVILGLAFAGLLILLGLTQFFGRRRLRGVRKRLLKRAAGAGGTLR